MATAHLSYADVQKEIDAIQQLVDQVDNAATELLEVIQKCMIRGIQTRWAIVLNNNLRQYYDNDMKDAMKDMKSQALKLHEISKEAEKYSNEED